MLEGLKSKKKQIIGFRCFQCLVVVKRKVSSAAEIENLICGRKRCQKEHDRMRHNRVYAKKYQRRLNQVKKQLQKRYSDILIEKLLSINKGQLFYGEVCLGRIDRWDREFIWVKKPGGSEVFYRIISIKNPYKLRADWHSVRFFIFRQFRKTMPLIKFLDF